MPIRLFCNAPGKHTAPFLHRLKALAGSDLEDVVHLGDTDADFKGSSLARMDTRRARSGHLMDGQTYRAANLPLLADPAFRQMMETTVDQMNRFGPAYRYRPHNLQNLQDYLDYYHILSDVMAGRLIDARSTHVLFFNIPHLVYDTVLYQVARSLGLQTVILTLSHFPNTSFSMAGIEDYGWFDVGAGAAPPLPIERGRVTDLFYMPKIDAAAQKTGRLTLRGLGHFAAYTLAKKPLSAFDPVYLWRVLTRMNRIYGDFPKWRDPFARFFDENELAYFEHLADYEGQTTDFTRKFVYFPLHLQPEMTTSALGGRYRDQVLAIEDLSRRLPDDWLIYVKENPKQGAYARGPMFFHRLKRIANVRFMPSNADTHVLIGKSQFVAVISGTAGWEAIKSGKPAVVMGQSWYRMMPGITAFSDDLDAEAVAATPIDHAALEQAAGALMARGHPGVAVRGWEKVLGTFDPETNVDNIAKAALGLLRGEIAFSFARPR